jgi:hypothetical protein
LLHLDHADGAEYAHIGDPGQVAAGL